MGKTGKKWKENHATKMTKIPKSKRGKYGMNETQVARWGIFMKQEFEFKTGFGNVLAVLKISTNLFKVCGKNKYEIRISLH